MARVRNWACVIGCLALASGCGQDDRSKVSAESTKGWARTEIPDCCSIALPPGATLAAMPNPIDDFSYKLDGQRFDGLLTITRMGSSLPILDRTVQVSRQNVMIDSREAVSASYSAGAKELRSERRYLVWTFEGRNDGTGHNLVLSFSCEPEVCSEFSEIIKSLRRVRN